jgi:hypothetical protein
MVLAIVLDMDFYVEDPILIFLAQGYHPSAERLVELVLEELGIRVQED